LFCNFGVDLVFQSRRHQHITVTSQQFRVGNMRNALCLIVFQQVPLFQKRGNHIGI